ncbi:hypothetical protein TNCV_1003361 [Trichonephila clavipes]|nr:hypothetical protein TNCV_1003361 [Trichonephila clavipes]
MLGLYDMNVLKVQLLLVTALEKENKFDEALKLIDEVIGNSFKCNDVNSSFVLLLCLSNKARLWQKLGNFKESIKIMNDIHVKIEEILDPHHPNILLVLTDLALIFYKQGEYEESLKILHRILDSEEVLFGTNHKRTLITQLQIADVLYKQDQFGEALRIYQKYLSEGAAILGEDNPMIRRARLTVHTINVSFESLASSKPVSRVRELKGTFKCTEKITIL